METKRYVMTIPVHLDNLSEKIVNGDVHFRGNRNQFFVEAIEKAVSVRLGAGALQLEPDAVPVKKESEEGEMTLPKKDSAPLPPPRLGRKPLLEWRDGAIRNNAGEVYKVRSVPVGHERQPKEKEEDYFNRVKTVPGVMLVNKKKVEKKISPLSSPILFLENNQNDGIQSTGKINNTM